jgi:glycosyltransferase involved in cell wall biosynthesis
MGASDRVHLRGILEAPWKEYAAADIFALPSLSEGFGRVYLEAAAYGLPVLASSQGGAGDIFSHDEALLLHPEIIADWGEALIGLAENPSLCKEMGQRAYRRARDFDLRHLQRRLEPILFRALRGTG